MARILAAAVVLASLAAAHASTPSVVMFDFVLIDTSLEGSMYAARPDEQARLAHLGDDLRGNTDESWSRTLDWLLRNRLFSAEPGARQ